MATDVEVVVLQRDTALLIAHEGRPVALTRPGTYARTGEGGQRLTGPPVAEEEPVKRWFQLARAEGRFSENNNGSLTEEGAVLIGLPDDPMAEKDTFTIDGGSWEIYEVNRDQRYETRARCREIT